MKHAIHIFTNHLTDGSLVYDVRFLGNDFPACTEQDAFALAEKIAGAINDHSLEETEVIVYEVVG